MSFPVFGDKVFRKSQVVQETASQQFGEDFFGGHAKFALKSVPQLLDGIVPASQKSECLMVDFIHVQLF